jgi:hypothetical protein
LRCLGEPGSARARGAGGRRRKLRNPNGFSPSSTPHGQWPAAPDHVALSTPEGRALGRCSADASLSRKLAALAIVQRNINSTRRCGGRLSSHFSALAKNSWPKVVLGWQSCSASLKQSRLPGLNTPGGRQAGESAIDWPFGSPKNQVPIRGQRGSGEGGDRTQVAHLLWSIAAVAFGNL